MIPDSREPLTREHRARVDLLFASTTARTSPFALVERKMMTSPSVSPFEATRGRSAHFPILEHRLALVVVVVNGKCHAPLNLRLGFGGCDLRREEHRKQGEQQKQMLSA